VLAGVALQETLRRHNVMSSPERRIEVRVAVNTGEVTLLDGNDVIGEAVNITARLQEVAEPNEVYLTESTYLSMNVAECVSVEVGSRTFKGISRPVKLYKAMSRSGAETFLTRLCSRRQVTWLIIPALCVAGMLWVAGRKRPPGETPAPAAEAPGQAEPLAEATAPEEASPPAEPAAETPAEPDPATVVAIAQPAQGFADILSTLEAELRQTHDQYYDWAREQSNQQVRCRRLSGRLNEVGRSIPQVRGQHTAAVQRRIDQANTNEDRATADALWRELGQFDVGLAGLEAQVGGWAAAVDEAAAALHGWDPVLIDWSKALTAMKQERSGYATELITLKTLTAWDPQLDTLGANLEALRARLAELQQAMAGLRAELDARAPTLDAADQFVTSWEDFREQWRTYLYTR
ncbi:MAG: adenylate/guanylate cyclase domain-containing protein, partial [bacterium]